MGCNVSFSLGPLSVVVEEDERTAYAYLLNSDRKIVADVWLYNVDVTPTEPEWRSDEPMPYRNPSRYVGERHETLDRITSESDVSVEPIEDGAELFLQNQLVARLKVGSRPGWSITASEDGPLAKVLKQ